MEQCARARSVISVINLGPRSSEADARGAREMSLKFLKIDVPVRADATWVRSKVLGFVFRQARAKERADPMTSLVRESREKSPRRGIIAHRQDRHDGKTRERARKPVCARIRSPRCASVFFLSPVSAVATALDPFSERDTMKLD